MPYDLRHTLTTARKYAAIMTRDTRFRAAAQV
jgi:hypothetical protein